MRLGEFERIRAIARALGERVPRAGIAVGIGDDAAVLEPRARAGQRLVWTVDAQVEGVHFRRDLVSLRDLGWRSFMAAASDLAAMGARPWCALSSLVLPADVDDRALAALVRGQRDAARAIGAAVVGGNLARGPTLEVTTTLLGSAARPVLRGGARAGDGLWLAGPVGLAAAGLRALLAGDAALVPRRAVAAWRRPVARIDEGLALAGIARAAIDVSDGLAQDVGHLAAASGLCAVLDASAIERAGGSTLARAARALKVSPAELALHGGEDYALVAASARPIAGFARIGELGAGRGIRVLQAGALRRIAPRGFDHFPKGLSVIRHLPCAGRT